MAELHERDRAGLDLRRLLDAVERAQPIDVVDTLAAELSVMVDARRVSLLIANFSGDALVRMSHVASPGRHHDGHHERRETLALASSLYERVLHSQQPCVEPAGDGVSVLLPVTERGDAIGVLEVDVPDWPEADTVAYLRSAAHALAYVLIASRRHTDLFEWAQRDQPFSLAAEIQRRLLPGAYTTEGGPFSLAGWLEPAHDAGGDTFDYAVDRDYLYASLTDAMGHSTEAALLATLTVGSLRNSRRAQASPAEQADAASAALTAHARADQFVTGLVLRIRLADGQVEMVNAGHPPPLLLRDGAIVALDHRPDMPLGVETERYRTQRVALRPGDRLLMVTDGYLERNAATIDIGRILVDTPERHPRQIVQELARRLHEAAGGPLADDATSFCVDWYGPGGDRDAHAGASAARATPVPPTRRR
ncbi:MAG TPA: PP2C family protein-serine/threonine phosphatase [Acidimicrobiales bacterium]|nr:PP2C family protein-serine/threonine phosphatase [Acidimicrobiales bacterium]